MIRFIDSSRVNKNSIPDSSSIIPKRFESYGKELNAALVTNCNWCIDVKSGASVF